MSMEPRESALYAALRRHPSGLYVEAAPAGAQASRLACEFAHAGWQGVQLAVTGDGTGADLEALLAGAGAVQPHWVTVRGKAAIQALENWKSDACRPAAVLVESGPLTPPATSAPTWREALARNGYLFAASDSGYDHFVRGDQGGLLAQVAEQASLAWRHRLQASLGALAQAQRDAEQLRSALLMAQSNAMAAQARATMLQQQIDAIHASASWKGTKPLRWAARLRREPGLAWHQLRTMARARLGIALGKVLRRLGAKVDASPVLRRRVAALAASHPLLARRVQVLLRAGMPAPSAMSLASPPAIDPDNVIGLPFRALLIDEIGRGQPPAP
jgi:hypothetical protein